MAVSWLVLILAAFALLAVAGAVTVVLVLVLRRPSRRAYDPDDAPSPLERAQDAASVLTPAEWEEFRRWVEGQRPLPPSASEGIAR
jgi:hypothetical protein